MAPNELRKAAGAAVTLHTGHGDLHGVLLSCTLESVWIVDDGERDVIVPLSEVDGMDRDAA